MKVVSTARLVCAIFVVSPSPVLASNPTGANNPVESTASVTVETPIVLGQQAPAGQMILPANTELTITPNDTISSKKVREKDVFTVSTVYDVILNGMIVIPRGSRGQAEVMWRTGKGAFGKSAKMEIEMRWLEVGGRRIGLEGKHRQEGEGNTGATIGVVVAAGPFGAFVTGKSAVIPNGMQLKAHTTEPVPFIAAHTQPMLQQATVVAGGSSVSEGTTPAISSTHSNTQ